MTAAQSRIVRVKSRNEPCALETVSHRPLEVTSEQNRVGKDSNTIDRSRVPIGQWNLSECSFNKSVQPARTQRRDRRAKPQRAVRKPVSCMNVIARQAIGHRVGLKGVWIVF